MGLRAGETGSGMTDFSKAAWSGVLLISLFLTACQDAPNAPPDAADLVAVDPDSVPEQVYWGDLHVHSSLSFDAHSFGNRNLGPEAAYRFARGETVRSSSGQEAKLQRPLDFLLVADHAEYLGFLSGIEENDALALATPLGKRWQSYLAGKEGMGPIMTEYVDMVTGVRPRETPGKKFAQSIWSDVIEIAERYNEPGRFTTFAGYEWTSMPGGRNLHRVVVFRDGPDKTGQIIPFSALDSDDPERLWAFLDQYEQNTSGSVLAIPHNGNLSGGIMFADETLSGSALSREYAKARVRWEPVYEVTQVKGDGEAHPLLSPDDEYADFETWDETDISLTPKPTDPEAKKRMLQGEYARSGLKKGLAYEAELGMNPYQFGMIGSTDSHTSLSTADDNNFWGKFKDSEPSDDRLESDMGGALWPNAKLTASGYTGIWARANTRAELFAAIKRREVYATTGPRIRLRVFAGWQLEATDLDREDFAARGYRRGVPMGGILAQGGENGAPDFLIRVMKDPDDANLERVQIIKGWRTVDGEVKEKVHDVGVAETEKGAVTFAIHWSDPDFNVRENAFYYVRVLQKPTERWTAYDKENFGVRGSSDYPDFIQERVYSSPIWYQPE
ncbi:Protein of unknown function [Parasphingorhabdus marina DSM 22363]|uniref:DUF3604 domain-containing protein n=2 Tax=Parasphingorhabdus marina TaxID=394732 RepID=A0A1N6DAR3_9SPHN|nr:Protein of unknown function [Parasphingorhabdus marina DSM 22363]